MLHEICSYVVLKKVFVLVIKQSLLHITAYFYSQLKCVAEYCSFL